MSDFILTCCSTADLPAEYFEEHDIPYLCFHFNLDGQEYEDDLGKSIPFDRFYEMISEGAMPKTSQPSIGQYVECWEPYLKEGKKIVHISLSSGLSGAYRAACSARDVLAIDFPSDHIHIIDSLGASSGYGLLVDTACKFRDEGKSASETAQWVEDNKLNLHHLFFSTDLTSYYRGGRIKKGAMLLGSALNICPVLDMNDEGLLTPRARSRGVRHAIKAILKTMEEHAQGGLDYSGKCFISQSACFDYARQVADLVEENFKKLDGKVMINSVGTVIGAHTGPGTVALFYWGDRRLP